MRSRVLAPALSVLLAAGVLAPTAQAAPPSPSSPDRYSKTNHQPLPEVEPDVPSSAVGLDPGATAAAAAKVTAKSNKGPVGWDVYRRLDRSGELRPGVQALQFSSFDRSGGNNDGFDGQYSCLRKGADGCVIAERAGAGEIQSIWFTRFGPTGGGDGTDTGLLKIELDGRVVLNAPLQDVVTGRLGAPFAWPLVGNGDDTAGGLVIKVPMPFRKSMRITTQNNPLFYHVGYRAFADADGVQTFDPRDKAQDVLDKLRAFGVRDPKPAVSGAVTQAAAVDVPAGGTAKIAQVTGSGKLTQVRVRLPQVEHAPRVVDDGRAHLGSSTFAASVARDNQGVRIVKRYDATAADQRATLLVDGKQAGTWDSGAARPGTWADQAIDIPAALTRGKSKIVIKNQSAGTGSPVSEFRYDVQSRVGGQWTRTDTLDVGAAHPGEEKAHGYSITLQEWQRIKVVQRYAVDPATVTASDTILDKTRLRITFDGRTTVDSPVGEFFGSGLGEYDVRSAMFAIDATADGWYTAWWPMPYGSSATVELVNGSGIALQGGRAEVTSARDTSVAGALTRGELGYFHATSHRGQTVKGRDWSFLDAQGTGVFYGVTQSMRGLIPGGNRRNYLEGDERVYADGALSPAFHGTGTEDFYESGWYFRDGTTYAMPTAGNPAYELDGDGCQYDCTGAYRLLIGDAVPFGSSLRFGIEHGPAADEPGDYGSTAYWYGQDRYQLKRTDALTIGDAADRQAHGYPAPGALATLTSTFEGDDDDLPVTRLVQSTSTPVTFTVNVASGNRGARLIRLGDQANAYQAADVFVGGKLVGRWLQPLGNTRSRWLEDSFDLPVSVTTGRTKLTVRLVPVPGAPAWTAAEYAVASRVAPFADTTAPAQVTGVTASGDETNSITVSWATTRDDTGVAAYEVYASKDPAGPWTLLGTTPVPSFKHRNLGLRETWYYRVRAIDGAGNIGPYSAVATGTSGNTAEVEGESLLPPLSANAPVEAQGNCCGVVWSNNAQLWFRPGAAGGTATFSLPVLADGTYDLSAVWTQAPDYGIVQVSIDGTVVGTFDGYFAGGVRTRTAAIGSAELTRGTHQLTLTVTGKNAAATGFLAGLDVVRLKLTS